MVHASEANPAATTGFLRRLADVTRSYLSLPRPDAALLALKRLSTPIQALRGGSPAPISWQIEVSGTPYAERREIEQSKLDLALARLQGRIDSLNRLSWKARLQSMADAVDALEQELRALDNEQLRARADGLRRPLLRQGFDPSLVAQVFSLTREVSRRRLGLRHHRAQIMGGWAMLSGALAEMETGEGKTITALLPSVAAALAGFSVHVITVNDYLAERDAAQLKPVFDALGLSAGLVKSDLEPDERRAAYAADITYCTNKEVVFDYLRDRMALGQKRSRSRLLVQQLLGRETASLLLRGLHFAIVDEADSILIDEARTPLILSANMPSGNSDARYRRALDIAANLVPGRDYLVSELTRHVELTSEGQLHTRALAAAGGEDWIWRSRRAREELIMQALSAQHLYQRDKHYIVAEGKVQIVDEYTGRVMADRSWEGGLHQMIETKEGCELTGRRRTEASITYQRFFRRYLHLCGMTGTAGESAPELWSTYGLKVVRIPTHNKLRRKDLGIHLHATRAQNRETIVRRVLEMSKRGQPVLIGTRSVAGSEELSRALAEIGLPRHNVLNARQDREEAMIVAEAGQPGRITVATNIAGRGTDIRLPPNVIESGGLHVILTEFHESARIDRQLFGRCARQGNPGSFECLVSIEDELFQRFVPGFARALAAALMMRAGSVVSSLLGHVLRWWGQRKAERVHAKTRRETVERDRQLEKALAFAGQAE
jgi:preprotein translocase subunit SecA